MTRPLRDPLAGHSTVAVLGLGAAGLGACRLLLALNKRVVASDANPALDTSRLPPGLDLRLGRNDIGDATAVVVSPGLNPTWPENQRKEDLAPIWEAWKQGQIELWSEIELAAAAFDGHVLSIGGTDGKSTTAAMTAHLLKGWGVDACLAGNSWTPFSAHLADGLRPEVAVLEVSAFQLWEPHRFHPDVAVLTNIAPDHLDHFASEADYVGAKRSVFRNLGAGDTVVLFADDLRLGSWVNPLREAGVRVAGYSLHRVGRGYEQRGTVGFAGDEPALILDPDPFRLGAIPVSDLPVLGTHNQKNALAALLAASSLPLAAPRIGRDATRRAFASFKGLPHRVELVRERKQVRFLDDSKATNVHAALAGIKSLEAPLVTIVGGVDKGLELAPLIEELARRARHVVVIGQIRSRFVAEAAGRIASIETALTMEDAVDKAAARARPGDIVLLAPACSSFDMFRGFEHRGEVFAAAVNALP
jgi:UDP-N-acetylmuramoylalanine--D-glutamate ligase